MRIVQLDDANAHVGATNLGGMKFHNFLATFCQQFDHFCDNSKHNCKKKTSLVPDWQRDY